MNLAFIDYIFIVAYMFGILVLGLWAMKRGKSDEDYLLAGRKLTLPAMVMSLVTTWYGAILGVGELVFRYGIVGWVTQGLLWYVIYLFFALMMAKKVQKSKKITIADHLMEKSGKKSAFVGTILTYIMTSPAPYILSLGVVIDMIFGIGLFLSILIGSLISGIYIWSGGFRSVVRVDGLQFALMYFGFGALLIGAVIHFGDMSFFINKLPPTHLTFTGELPILTIAAWGLMALWTLVDPDFFQRCYASGSGKIARNGILWSILFWFIFDMLTLITGLYATAAFPNAEPTSIYFVLADNVLPFAIKGIFCVSVLAIIMSTMDSFLFTSGTIMGKDLLGLVYPKARLKKLSRIGIVITIVVSLILIVLFKSVIGIIYVLGTVGVSALLLPVLLAIFSKQKMNDNIVLSGMLAAITTSVIWLIGGLINSVEGWPQYWLGIDPMYVGLAASLMVYVLTRKILFID
ncbi:MAG: sodium:solute symporter family protein [Candidatus Saccharibacteria bacterium]